MGSVSKDALLTFAPDTPATAIYAWFGPGSDSRGVVRRVAEGRLEDVLAVARAEPLPVQADIHVEVGEVCSGAADGRRVRQLRDSYSLADVTCTT